MSDLTKPPILDDTGQTIKTKLTAILQALQNAGNVFIPKTQKGAASGVAELDSNGKVPTGQIPTLSQYMVKGTDYVTAGLQSGETLGDRTTVEGFNNKGRGTYNHVEGSNNGDNTGSHNVHVEGEDNAIGGSGQYGLHIEGKGNDGHYAANYAHIGGKYANVDSLNGADWAYLVGNGTADNSRSNAFGVTWNGDAIAGRSNGLSNSNKLATGADVVSYLNSNLVNDSTVTSPQNQYSSVALAKVYKIYDKIAIISFKGVLNSSLAGRNALLFTLPSGYRPSTVKSASCYTAYNDVAGFYNMAINTDGTVTTNIGSGTVTGTICFEAAVYLL